MRTINIVNDNGEYIGDKKYGSSTNTYIIENLKFLDQLRDEISNSIMMDSFLAEYNKIFHELGDKTKILSNENVAKHRLFSFHEGLLELLVNELSECNFETMIGGSSGIASVLKRTEIFKGFEPSDIDLYVKNISGEKIITIDNIIRKITQENHIFIVRRPLTLTWWIYDKFENFIAEIQLCSLHINSWAEIFAYYHSNVVSIGYDIKKACFVVLEKRWNNFINEYPNVNIANVPKFSQSNIEFIGNKYTARGFNCTVINIIDKNVAKNIVTKKRIKKNTTNVFTPSGTTHKTNKTNTDKKILPLLKEIYKYCDNVLFSDNISDLVDIKNQIFLAYNQFNTEEEEKYMRCFTCHECDVDNECPITLEKYRTSIFNKNCCHEISLKAGIYVDIDCCPICRSSYVPYIIKL